MIAMQKYLEYIKNADPTVKQFDEDWEPIGFSVRLELFKADLIYYIADKIYIR